MPPGITGPLISQDFLDTSLLGVCPAAAALETWRVSDYRRWHRSVTATLGPASARRAVFCEAGAPLFAWLGLRVAPGSLTIDEHGFEGVLLGPGLDSIAFCVVEWAAPPGRARRQAVRRALMVGTRWALVTNGQIVELVDALRPRAQQHLTFDLRICRDVSGSLAMLFALCGAAAFRRGTAGAPIAAVVAAADRHAVRVCTDLADGVRFALEDLTRALLKAGRRRSSLSEAYEHALTAVYRVLFLLFAESRGLVPAWHPVYRDAYTVASLCDRLATGAPARGTWATLQAIARLARDGAVSGDLTVTAFNGRLFAPAAAPLLDDLRLDDEAVGRALRSLTMTAARSGGARRIAYRDLGVAQLGSVYERLLDYAPDPTASHAPRLIRHGHPGRQRKTTGTFYTPRSITDFLVRRTLGPLVANRTPAELLQLRVVDPAMGSGAFLVAACRFIADAYETALIAAGDAGAGDLDDRDRASFRRTVASRCLFGVDLNPMAVQLTRLSLWLTTLAADRPLSFLDHHLVVGNSLIGATPIDLAAQAPGGRIRPGGPGPLDTLLRTEHMLSAVLPVRKRLESDADDTVDVVRDKERALRRLDRIPDLERWRIACDLWCAAWFDAGPGDHRVSRAVIDDLLGRYSSLPAATLESAARAALGIVGQQHPCHWPLAFPEVFVDASGKYAADAGFDAVVGNPPWEMLRREPGTGEGRAGPRRGLLRFTRESGVYRTPPRGHVNLYHLFVERALFLARSGGRVGLVVPMGLLTDESSGVLRRRLFDECLLDGVIGFDNRRRIFPIHRSVRFALLTASTAGRTDAVGCRLGETDADVLDRLDPESGFTVTVTRNLLERVSGPDLAVPHLQTREDLVLTERLYARLPALGASAGWQARFSRELNATEDRELFRRGDAAVNGDLPVVEGRHLSPFRVDLRGTTVTASAEAVRRRLGRRDFTRRPRLAYRDVAGAANRQTLIAAVLPAGVVSVHTVFCLRNALPAAEQDLLCALLNSYVANYLVRQRVSTHVTTAILNRIPVPRPSLETALGRELATRSAALRTGDSRPHAMAAIQADAARAWSLTSRELQHVLTTFPLIADAEKQLVLDSFSRRTRQ